MLLEHHKMADRSLWPQPFKLYHTPFMHMTNMTFYSSFSGAEQNLSHHIKHHTNSEPENLYTPYVSQIWSGRAVMCLAASWTIERWENYDLQVVDACGCIYHLDACGKIVRFNLKRKTTDSALYPLYYWNNTKW